LGWTTYLRYSRSRESPAFSNTRAEALLSASHVASTRYMGGRAKTSEMRPKCSFGHKTPTPMWPRQDIFRICAMTIWAKRNHPKHLLVRPLGYDVGKGPAVRPSFLTFGNERSRGLDRGME